MITHSKRKLNNISYVSQLNHDPLWCDIYYMSEASLSSTVKPVYKDHPMDQQKVVSNDRWSLYRGALL